MKSPEIVPNFIIYKHKIRVTLYLLPELNKPVLLNCIYFELWENFWYAGVWSVTKQFGICTI